MPENSTLELWNVQFDNDQFSYTYTSSAKLLQSVASFLDVQLNCDIGTKDEAVQQLVEKVREHLDSDESQSALIIMTGDARIKTQKFVLDNHNPLVKVLEAAYPQVDEETQRVIDGLLTQPPL